MCQKRLDKNNKDEKKIWNKQIFDMAVRLKHVISVRELGIKWPLPGSG